MSIRPSRYPNLIFDLDGTLTDSKPGIVGCLRKALDARNLGDQGPLEHFVGPPVEVWTAELMPDSSQEARDELIRDYRACYDREGWMNNSVYPGVESMLARLREQGFDLYVCTSKPRHFAIRILDSFKLSSHFTAVYGDRPEYASHSKALLLASLLREHTISPENSLMIGDRIYDIEAAHSNGMRCVAAAWGYGSVEESAQADAIARTPADVVRIVFGDSPKSPGILSAT
ncbi:MAG: HAD hydrolase-like protein [Terracidiphilus sp.]|jgi:phosphoglycolate phosphatase